MRTLKEEPPKSQSGLLSYLLLLTGLFALVEISFFLQSSGLYFADFDYITHHLSIPITIIPGVLFYLFAQSILHVLFTVIIWLLARLVSIATNTTWQQTQKLGFNLWGLGLATVLLANQHYFPNSKFAGLTSIIFPTRLANYLFIGLEIFFLLISTVAVIGLMRLWIRKFSLPSLCACVAVGLSFLTNCFLMTPVIVTAQDAATKNKPNIIIIGIDSLRPDTMSYLGGDFNTPHLNDFFDHAVVFGEAVTPIARTFPSWVSLLTGYYPKINGARFDLVDQKKLALSQALPAILKNQGYETLYAMDETRFSNIGKNFGFDKIVTPPVGLNDFLIGTFNDFPLSNLVINTKVGAWLFPYSYANRAAFITYQPNTFLKLITPALAQNRTKPLFLAIHFCLPHFPYLWADYRIQPGTNAVDRYYASLHTADKQFAAFMQLLQQQNLLNHSIVILLSDHGESLELPGDRITAADNFISHNKRIPHFYPPSLDDEKVDEAVGHGTDVLSLNQYHSVLAFRFYGDKDIKPKTVSGIVTLMDIKPTLLDFLNISMSQGESVSLMPMIAGNQPIRRPTKHIFLESDFSPQSIHSAHPETRQMVFDGIDFFQIDPKTTRLTIKPEMGKLIISSKQLADIYGDWILALYPNEHQARIPILVNLTSGKWTNDLTSTFAQHSPANQMLQALKKFYGNEIQQIAEKSA